MSKREERREALERVGNGSSVALLAFCEMLLDHIDDIENKFNSHDHRYNVNDRDDNTCEVAYYQKMGHGND